jgi:hypothetical protein
MSRLSDPEYDGPRDDAVLVDGDEDGRVAVDLQQRQARDAEGLLDGGARADARVDGLADAQLAGLVGDDDADLGAAGDRVEDAADERDGAGQDLIRCDRGGDLDHVADADVGDLALEHGEADPQGAAVGDREGGVAGLDGLTAEDVDLDDVARDRGGQRHQAEGLVGDVPAEGLDALLGGPQLGVGDGGLLQGEVDGPLRGDALFEELQLAALVGVGVLSAGLDGEDLRLGLAELGALHRGEDIAGLDLGALDHLDLADPTRDARADGGDPLLVELEHAGDVHHGRYLGDRGDGGLEADALGEGRRQANDVALEVGQLGDRLDLRVAGLRVAVLTASQKARQTGEHAEDEQVKGDADRVDERWRGERHRRHSAQVQPLVSRRRCGGEPRIGPLTGSKRCWIGLWVARHT